jgi:hypothetical protein
VVMLSGHLNTRWTLCKQQSKLRSKCSEMEKGTERTLGVSHDENCTLQLYLFCQQKCALFHRHSVYSVRRYVSKCKLK